MTNKRFTSILLLITLALSLTSSMTSLLNADEQMRLELWGTTDIGIEGAN